jgi:hypothetical protein
MITDMPVVGPHSEKKETVMAYIEAKPMKHKADVRLLAEEYFAQNVFDGFGLFVQAVHEADAFNSAVWEAQKNHVGLGVTDGGNDMIVFKDGRDAARAAMIHHAAYTGITLPDTWKAWKPLDPRYQKVIDAGFFGKVKKWGDYGNGLWATDPNYGQGLRNREAQVRAFATTTAPPTGGTMPNIIDRWLHVAQLGYGAVNRRIIGRRGMTPKIIVLHIQEGYNLGSWQHFHAVSASSTVLIGKTGDIWRLVPEEDGPWTNGDVNRPSAKGLAIINKYGADPNVYSLTIETEGFTGEWPKAQAQLDSVVWQIATWQKKYNIPLENVLRHADINSVSRPNCPGNAFYNYVISKLQGGVDVEVPTTYAKPAVVQLNSGPWLGDKNVSINNVVFNAEKRTVDVSGDGLRSRQYASTMSGETRAPYKINDTIDVLGWVKGEAVDNESRWWITKDHSRVWVGGTKQKPGDTPTVPPTVPTVPPTEPDVTVDLPEGVSLVNGIVYYDAKKGDQERVVTVTYPQLYLRSKPDRTSDPIRMVHEGDELTVSHWCFGKEVNKESVWWVVDEGTFADGPYLFVAATAQRPE